MFAPADLADPLVRARATLAVVGLAGPAVGGLWLRARPSPARDAMLAALEAVVPEAARIGPETEEIALSGGVDVGASLAAGRRVLAEGVLARTGRITLATAERSPPALAARLARALDGGGRFLVALDEGSEAEECLAPVLAARAGLYLALEGIGARDAARITAPDIPPGDIRDVSCSAKSETDLVSFAARIGVHEPRLLLAARAAARAFCMLRGGGAVTAEDIACSAGLVLVPRGRIPADQPEVEDRVDDARPEADADDRDGDPGDSGFAEDRLTDAEVVRLPAEVLALSASAPARGSRGSGAGASRRGSGRGRPLPSRPGHAGTRSRIDPVATLRAAIPWQRLRPPSPRGQPVALRPSDIRIRKFQERSDRVVIFAVDASGSLAMARMAEAKGAVECLLGEAYRRRDQVALIAFRGRSAEVLLPPTRALVRARNALVALPAGGATPLAAGLCAASDLAARARSAGATPIVVLLSDGKANIALDGAADRRRAAEESDAAARRLAADGVEALVLDTGRRPEASLKALSRSLGGRYIAMPHARAREMSAAVSAALDG